MAKKKEKTQEQIFEEKLKNGVAAISNGVVYGAYKDGKRYLLQILPLDDDDITSIAGLEEYVSLIEFMNRIKAIRSFSAWHDKTYNRYFSDKPIVTV